MSCAGAMDRVKTNRVSEWCLFFSSNHNQIHSIRMARSGYFFYFFLKDDKPELKHFGKLGPISHFLSPVSCDSLVLQGLRCECGAGVLNLVLSLSLSHTGHWKFNMAPHGKELSEDLKKIIVALHKDGVGYKKVAKTLKLSCSTVAKTIQRFNRTGSTQNRPRHGRPKKLSARAQHHIQRVVFGK